MLKGPHKYIDPDPIVSEYVDFEYCDITSMTSWSRVTSSMMTSFIDAPFAVLYKLPITGHEPLNRSVFEIFVADRQTDTRTC